MTAGDEHPMIEAIRRVVASLGQAELALLIVLAGARLQRLQALAVETDADPSVIADAMRDSKAHSKH